MNRHARENERLKTAAAKVAESHREFAMSNLECQHRPAHYAGYRDAAIQIAAGIRLLSTIPSNPPAPSDGVSLSIYEAAVKGRQDFRNSYRKLLPVQRAAEAICRLWRSPQHPFQVTDEFADAINALDVATTGGGAKPDYALTNPAGEGVRARALEEAARVADGDEPLSDNPGVHLGEVRAAYRIASRIRALSTVTGGEAG